MGILVISALLWGTLEVQNAKLSRRGSTKFQLIRENNSINKILDLVPKNELLLKMCPNVANPNLDRAKVLHPYININSAGQCTGPLPGIVAPTPADRDNWRALAGIVQRWPLNSRGTNNRQDAQLSNAFFTNTVRPALIQAGCISCHDGTITHFPGFSANSIKAYDFRFYDQLVDGVPIGMNSVTQVMPPLATPLIFGSKLGQRMWPVIRNTAANPNALDTMIITNFLPNSLLKGIVATCNNQPNKSIQSVITLRPNTITPGVSSLNNLGQVVNYTVFTQDRLSDDPTCQVSNLAPNFFISVGVVQ